MWAAEWQKLEPQCKNNLNSDSEDQCISYLFMHIELLKSLVS